MYKRGVYLSFGGRGEKGLNILQGYLEGGEKNVSGVH